MNNKHIVAVIGMHRSGTSAIARALAVLGISLGTRLLPADPGNNDKGFFEDIDIKAFNEDLLRAMGHDWHTLEPVSIGDPVVESLSPFIDRALALIHSKLEAADLFGMKDPRVSRLMPFWNRIFDQAGVRVTWVIAYRNPGSVARSLFARDHFVAEKSYCLWLEYLHSSLTHSASRARLVVDYDALIDDPAGQLRRIADCAGLVFDRTGQAYAEFAGEFVEKGMRHAQVNAAASSLDPAAPPLVSEMNSVLQDLASDRLGFESTELSAVLARSARWLEDMHPSLRMMRACDDGALELAWRVYERDAQIAALEQELAAVHAGVAPYVSQTPATHMPTQGKAPQSSDSPLAVVIHAFYIAEFEQILSHLQALGSVPLRLFVTCPVELAEHIRERLHSIDADFLMQPVPNRGRDILPFLRILPLVIERGHPYLLKLHTKRSGHRADGAAWCHDLYDKLVTSAAIDAARERLAFDPETGIIGPDGHVVPMGYYWGSNAVHIERLAAHLGVATSEADRLCFAAGSMFFARTGALLPLLALGLKDADFEEEAGQVDGTLAHAIERAFSLSASAAGLTVTALHEQSDPESPYPFANRSPSPERWRGDGQYVSVATTPLPHPPAARVICFYLPQYHPIPENDAWWGEGFTDWKNVRAAQPQFAGHYQPHVPDTLGYYDLRDPEVQRKQVELARLYGVAGFCFYFYWFGGKRLLDVPTRAYLDDPTLDLPFCLCWANENWTRRWDGLEDDILIEQQHSPDDDIAFIKHVAEYMRDARYIRIDGKPLLLIYRPSLLPSSRDTAQRWRDWCRANGIGEIILAYTQSFETTDPAVFGFDAAVEFPPSNSVPPNLSQQVLPLLDEFDCNVLDWSVLVERSHQYKTPAYPLFRSVCPGWDNTARRKVNRIAFIKNTPALYRTWLENAIRDTCQRFAQEDRRLVFVNAWNEWSEGAHLEPDRRYGYAWLQSTRDALMSQRPTSGVDREFPDRGATARHGLEPGDAAMERIARVAAAYDAKIAELHTEMADRDDRLCTLSETVAGNERQIDDLSRQLDAIARRNEHLIAALAAREASVNRLGGQLRVLEERLCHGDDEHRQAQTRLQRLIAERDAERAGTLAELEGLREVTTRQQQSQALLERTIADRDTSLAALSRDHALLGERIGNPRFLVGRLLYLLPGIDAMCSAIRNLQSGFRWKGLEFELQPLRAVSGLGQGRYLSDDADPQFRIVASEAPFPPGLVLFRIRGGAERGGLFPVLYLDDGTGFRESLRIELPFVSAAGTSEQWVEFPAGVRAVRFDPLSCAGEFWIENFEWILAGRYSRELKLLAPHAKRAIHDPAWALRMLRPTIQILRNGGFSGLRAYLKARAERGTSQYGQWIGCHDSPTESARAQMRRKAAQWPDHPVISVIMPVFNPPPDLLEQAIRSVQSQNYPHWELCIADDASTDKRIWPLLSRLAREDSRIKIVRRDTNGHISAASNSAIELASGSYLALLDQDDLLAEHALFCVAQAINQNPHAALLYSDEDKIDVEGKRHDPHFKCDWNLHLFRSQNFICHLGVYKTSMVRGLGGFRVGLEGAQDYDLALRCIERLTPEQIVHIPRVLYHWRVIPGSTAFGGAEKPYAVHAGQRALAEHLQRQGVDSEVAIIPDGRYRINYALPSSPPLVTVIIPTRNGLHLLKQCIDSVFAKTTYPNYEILVIDNGSDDPATRDYLEGLASKGSIRVMPDPRPFNFSGLNNAAVRVANGELVCLLNNDIEVISPEWLSEMVSLALLPGAGAIGARLWFPNETLQHGGVILGLGGVAGHAHKHLPRGDPGYCYRAALRQNLSAVTAACLLVRRSTYLEVGGLDEENLAIAFNDVDFCLKLLERGYINIWTPFAELYHHESVSRGYEDTPEKQERFSKEVEYMQRRWKDRLAHDPAYSPNLTLASEDFSLAWPPR